MKNYAVLLMVMLGMSIHSFGQVFHNGDYYHSVDYTDGECAKNYTAVITYGENINDDAHIQSGKLTFSSPSTVITDGCPSWFGVPVQQFENGSCMLMSNFGGVDMTPVGRGKVSLVAHSNVNGAKLDIYIGYKNSTDDFPQSSTWYTGSGTVKYEIVLTTTPTTYTFDYEGANPTVWSGWADKDKVNVIGYTPATADAEYYIEEFSLSTFIIVRLSGNENKSVQRTSAVNSNSNSCGTVVPANPLSIFGSNGDQALEINTESNGHIQIDPSFPTDKAVVTDMFGRTEEFSGNDFYTQLRGVLVVSCVSGNKVKKVKVIM